MRRRSVSALLAVTTIMRRRSVSALLAVTTIMRRVSVPALLAVTTIACPDRVPPSDAIPSDAALATIDTGVAVVDAALETAPDPSPDAIRR